MPKNSHQWHALARELYTMSQAGLAYSKNDFDLERYRRLQEISAEIIAGQSKLEKEAILESFAMQNGYPTPKVDVRGAVVRDGKILLVQEITDGNWSLPGGWADLGQSPREMVEREVLEESGMTVSANKVVAIYDANRFAPLEFWHTYKVVFLCEIFVAFYSQIPEHMDHIKYLFFGLHGHGVLVPFMWTSMALMVLAIIMLVPPAFRANENLLAISCGMVFIGTWIDKGLGMISGGFVPNPLHEVNEYVPTIPELIITLGVWAAGFLVLTVLFKITVGVKEEVRA